MKWWKKNRDNLQWEFVSCLREPLGEPVLNPGQGWYSTFTFRIGEVPDVEKLSWSINADERLVLLLIDIGQCRGEDLTEEMLEHVRQVFAFFAANGREMIVRTVYDTEGKGMEREPSFQDQIQRHMRQLGPLFREFSENICTLQGLFVGSWGEMHDSRYLSEKKLKELAETLWEASGGACYIAVRTPRQKRQLEGTCIPADRVGVFNDGLFGSDTHLGTFGTSGDTTVRGEAWLPALEMAYLNESTRQTPNGGEAVYGGEFDDRQVVETLEKMHISYLNQTYDGRILEQWKGKPYGDNSTLYEYIGLHLGYRFAVNRVWLENHDLCIEGRNEGFGNLYKKACARLMVVVLPEEERDSLKEIAEKLSQVQAWENPWILEKKEWQTEALELQANPRQWECGSSFTLRGNLPEEPAGAMLLFLELRQLNGEFIHFANDPVGNRLFLGFIPR